LLWRVLGRDRRNDERAESPDIGMQSDCYLYRLEAGSLVENGRIVRIR
jgi:hypothetical protein